MANRGNRHQKKSQKYLCSKHCKKKRLNKTLNNKSRNGWTDFRKAETDYNFGFRKTCKPKLICKPNFIEILELSVPAMDRKTYLNFWLLNTESIQKRVVLSFFLRTITMRIYLHFLSRL